MKETIKIEIEKRNRQLFVTTTTQQQKTNTTTTFTLYIRVNTLLVHKYYFESIIEIPSSLASSLQIGPLSRPQSVSMIVVDMMDTYIRIVCS